MSRWRYREQGDFGKVQGEGGQGCAKKENWRGQTDGDSTAAQRGRSERDEEKGNITGMVEG